MKVYAVMSTHPNESQYDLHSIHASLAGAEQVAQDIRSIDEEDCGEDAQLEVWVEEHEVKA